MAKVYREGARESSGPQEFLVNHDYLRAKLSYCLQKSRLTFQEFTQEFLLVASGKYNATLKSESESFKISMAAEALIHWARTSPVLLYGHPGHLGAAPSSLVHFLTWTLLKEVHPRYYHSWWFHSGSRPAYALLPNSGASALMGVSAWLKIWGTEVGNSCKDYIPHLETHSQERSSDRSAEKPPLFWPCTWKY